ncbi:MAG: DUF2442 domain-containing protein [Vulcanimicrobiaceae bacterium]
MAKSKTRVDVTDAEIDLAIARGKVWEEQHQYRPRAVAAEYRPKDDILAITLASGVQLLMPRKLLQGLENADPRDVAKVDIDDFGEGLHWESLDVDHYVPSLIEGVFGNRRWMSEIGKRGGAVRSDAKARAARKNGRKGGRPRKVAA